MKRTMPQDRIRRLMDHGYGFIKAEPEEDIFFHRNDIERVHLGKAK